MKYINRSMEQFLLSLNFWSVLHFDLEGFVLGLYRDDLVHLDIFNTGLQSIIEKAVFFSECL